MDLLDGRVVYQIPIMGSRGIQVVRVRENPFGDRNTLVLQLPYGSGNKVVLPREFLNTKPPRRGVRTPKR